MAVHSTLSDQELLLLLKQDDELALSALYMRYWDKLLVVAANHLENPEEAEEVLQDIFFSLWQRRANLELKYSLATYLAVAVKYRIINVMDKQYRLRSKTEKISNSMPDSFAPSAESALLEKELLEQIAASVKRLPEKCRIVFTLSRMEGKTHKEIANELNISEKTVTNHLTKAIKDIRNDMTIFYPALIWLLDSGKHADLYQIHDFLNLF